MAPWPLALSWEWKLWGIGVAGVTGVTSVAGGAGVPVTGCTLFGRKKLYTATSFFGRHLSKINALLAFLP